MRVVIDTNVLISSLLSPDGLPNRLVEMCLYRRGYLVSSESQIEEIRRVTGYERVRRGLLPASAGELVNQLRLRATMVTPISGIDASPDPGDNFLLGMAQAGAANYLVSGDKRHVLDLKRWQGTHIVTARRMADILKLG